MLSAITCSNWRAEDATGGVQSLIDKGKSSQASSYNSVPSEDSRSQDVNSSSASGFSSSPNAKPLFNSLAGFALEVGDRLLINGEEVIFKGWVDQSQTAIEVKAIADAAVIKQVRAKEIQSLARSQDSTAKQTSAPNSTQNKPEKSSNPSSSKESGSTEASDRGSSDRVHDDQKSPENFDHSEVLPEPETIETPKEPEYNAWEVWTYLERQRVNTLKLLNTFHAEWEANRFVREAERSAPSNLRVHYEVRPLWLDEAEIKRSYQNTEPSHKSSDHQSDRNAKDYADAIDVEVVTDSR